MPLWRDVRVLRWIVQLAIVAVVAAIVIWLFGNYTRNAEQANIPTNFDFLDNPASFQITGNSLSQSAPVRDALIEGLLNTLRVCVAGVIAATILGTLDRDRPSVAELDRAQDLHGLRRGRAQHPARPVPRRWSARHRPRRVPEHQRRLGLPRADHPVEPRPGRAVVRQWQRARTAPDPADRRPSLVGAGPVANIGVEPHGRAGAVGPVGRSGVRRGRRRRLVRGRLHVERAGRRGAGHGRRDAGRSVVLRVVLRPRDLHRQPHRGDRPRLDPGGPAGSGRGGRRGRVERVPEDVVRHPAAGDAHRHPAAREPVPQPDQELLARRGHRLLRPHARRQDVGRQRFTGRAGVRAHDARVHPAVAVTSFIVNVANRRMALVERCE